jgi:hypothetical protein
MQNIQIQEFNNISNQKIYLESVENLKQHLNDILKISDQTLTNNLIEESDFLFKQAEDSSKKYWEKYKIFDQLNTIWFNQWGHYRDRPEAIDLIKSIDNLTNYFTAYSKVFIGLSFINEGRTGNEREDLERIASGLLILSECVDVFIEYFPVSELKQIYLGVKNLFASTNRNIFEYHEKKLELSNLETQLRAYISLILLRIERVHPS